MILLDVNVLVYAYNTKAERHEDYRSFLVGVLEGPAAYGYSDLVLSGFVRIVTHPRIFDPPSTVDQALAFVHEIRRRSNAVSLQPGRRHWEIFTGLCTASGAKGNLVADAYHAALAIESGSEWITTDRGFSRFAGLRWRHPLT